MSLIGLPAPTQLFLEATKVLDDVGPQAFFSSPKESVKKAREGLAILFYMFAVHKATSKFWWVQQATKQDPFPDFYIFMIDGPPLGVEGQGVELVEIKPEISSYEEARRIIESKISKGYPPGFHLLIFLNNTQSTEWLPQINSDFQYQKSFNSVSVLHLLSKNGQSDLEIITVTELGSPWFQVVEELEEVGKNLPHLPRQLFEETFFEGQEAVRLKPEVDKELKKRMAELRIMQMKKQRGA